MRENTRSPQKKLLVAGLAVALGAGIVGVGANWDSVTSVVGNQFTATVDDGSAIDRENALLEVRGAAISKDFDTTLNNDQVVAVWTIANIGGHDAQFAANFVPGASIDTVLAEHLDVFYTVDGVERRAGTLAAPDELTAVTGLDDILPAGDDVQVSVRVVLPDPSKLLVSGVTAPEDVLSVVANWDVQYLTVSAEAPPES